MITYLYESFYIFTFENHSNFEGGREYEGSIDGTTLKQRIKAMPEDSMLLRSDLPEYHTADSLQLMAYRLPLTAYRLQLIAYSLPPTDN